MINQKDWVSASKNFFNPAFGLLILSKQSLKVPSNCGQTPKLESTLKFEASVPPGDKMFWLGLVWPDPAFHTYSSRIS